MSLLKNSAIFLSFFLIIIITAPVSMAHHSSGLQPDPNPSPAPWVRQVLNLDKMTGANGALTGKGVRIVVLDSMLQKNDPVRSSLERTNQITYRDFMPGDWGDNQHGSSVLGLLADPVYGTAPGADFMYARVCSDSCSTWSIAAAIRWAVRVNADIIVTAFGALTDSLMVEESLKYAQDNGILVVAAAGNLSCLECPILSYEQSPLPAKSGHVLAVGALGYGSGQPEVAKFTAKGSYVDLAAPGLFVPAPGAAGVRVFGGTSAAAPITAGVAALLLEDNAKLTPEQLASALTSSASFVPNSTVEQVGSGALDPVAALNLARQGDFERTPLEPLPQNLAVPRVNSAKWTGSGLEIKFKKKYDGALVLIDPSGAPVATTTSSGRDAFFEYPLHAELVKWKGKWSVASSYNSPPSFFKPSKLPLPAPKIKSVETTSDSVNVSWHPVPGATGYIVLAAGLRAYTSDLFLSFQGLTPGFPTSIQVFAMNGPESAPPASPPSAIRYARPAPDPPPAPSITLTESGVVFTALPEVEGIVEVVRDDGAWWEVNLVNGQASLSNSELGERSVYSWTGRARVWQNVNGYYRPGSWSTKTAFRKAPPNYLTIDERGNYISAKDSVDKNPTAIKTPELPLNSPNPSDTSALNPEYSADNRLSFYYQGPWQGLPISQKGWDNVFKSEASR
jgi:hypothetical protein